MTTTFEIQYIKQNNSIESGRTVLIVWNVKSMKEINNGCCIAFLRKYKFFLTKLLTLLEADIVSQYFYGERIKLW